MSGQAQSFVIMLAGGASEHAQRLLDLEALVLDAPESLLIKLVGSGGIHPTAALAFLDVLALLPARTKRAVIAYSHLLGAGDFVLWLQCASHRNIRPRATVYVESAAPAHHLEHFGSGRVVIAPLVMPAGDVQFLPHDYRECLSLISQHVELGLVLDHTIARDGLRELLLIDSYGVDDLLSVAQPAAVRMPEDHTTTTRANPHSAEDKTRADQ